MQERALALATASNRMLALHSNRMVAPMDQASRQCILCLRGISERTKPEHILLNALGGRATVEGLVCSTCNETMGHGPDQDLADSVGMLRNIANLLKGDGGGPPTIHGMQSEGMTFDVRPGMQVRPRHDDKKIRITKQDNEINIAITATSDAELHQLMENAARAIAKDLGHTKPEVIAAIHADLLRDHNRNDAIVPAPSITSQFQFGEGRSQQSMAKAAFVLWARLVGGREAVQPRYDRIRQFIFDGDKPDQPATFAKIDYRPLPPIPDQFGSNPNIIQAVSDASGAVHGYFRLYGAIGWRFLLCEAGAPPNRAQSLISNPFENKIYALASDGDALLPTDWILADWNLDIAEMDPILGPLDRFMEHSQETAQRMMLKGWVEEAMRLRPRLKRS
jgi:hypothetical protein